LPGTGGTNGYEPVASTSVSYARVRPAREVTVRAAVSMRSAGSSRCSSIPCRSMKPSSTIDKSSGVFPEKYEVRRTRS
jgi:hypothetical protein